MQSIDELRLDEARINLREQSIRVWLYKVWGGAVLGLSLLLGSWLIIPTLVLAAVALWPRSYRFRTDPALLEKWGDTPTRVNGLAYWKGRDWHDNKRSLVWVGRFNMLATLSLVAQGLVQL